ncbi:hypothetical protein RchiOBHm_Chr7g0195081 [Rosa chinensis]|uniref:Uncharacterized protein n=1 Tax=Rosa chinensis TaxID=74649 RepID=A0A2P6P6A7_ROSCH|nr:hypothetical protein RchiOBHm_Chr7g0195081 [Rosa chinensis]
MLMMGMVLRLGTMMAPVLIGLEMELEDHSNAISIAAQRITGAHGSRLFKHMLIKKSWGASIFFFFF